MSAIAASALLPAAATAASPRLLGGSITDVLAAAGLPGLPSAPGLDKRLR